MVSIRLLPTLLVAVVMSTFAVAVTGLPAAAAPSACTPNSDDPATGPSPRCINLVMLASRGWLKHKCVTDLPAALIGRPPYIKRECGGNGLGVEAIGQSRAIALLNMQSGDVPADGVNADVQWETRISGKLADILWYNHSATTQTNVQVVEAKTTDNPDYNDWNDQLMNRYINPLINDYHMASVHPGVILLGAGLPYFDEFQVDDPKVKCESKADLVRYYFATVTGQVSVIR